MTDLQPGDRVIWEYVVPGRVSLREIAEWESPAPFPIETKEAGGVVLAVDGEAVTVEKDDGGCEVFRREHLRRG